LAAAPQKRFKNNTISIKISKFVGANMSLVSFDDLCSENSGEENSWSFAALGKDPEFSW
jgi:hypothetical protein